MFVNVLPPYVYMCHISTCYCRGQKAVSDPLDCIHRGLEPCGYLDKNPGLLQEQQILFTPDLHLLPFNEVSKLFLQPMLFPL